MSPRLATVLLGFALLQSGARLAADAAGTAKTSSETSAIVVPAAEAVNERVGLAPTAVAALSNLDVNEAATVQAWPVAPGLRRTLHLTRYDVYGPGAKILRVDRTGPVELPRSPLRFFSGAADGDSDTRALVIFDPRTRTVTAFTETPRGAYELSPTGGAGDAHLLAPRAARALLETPADLNCVASCGPAPIKGLASALTLAAPLTSLHSATIAIDTDNELMLNTFGDNTVVATDYFAQMFAGLNVIYERDHNVRLLQGTTLLRVSSTPDPYNNLEGSLSLQLGEVYVQWSNYYSHVKRAHLVMISGLTNAAGAGYSGLNTVCQNDVSVARIPGVTNPQGPVALVGHEIGHAFGAVHTHCAYDPFQQPSDQCWNGEANRGCWAGAQSCPAPATYSGIPNVQGTIMSYCGRIGCPTTTVFHPDSANAIGTALTAKVGVCIFDAVPKFSIEGGSVSEGQVGKTLLSFTIKLSAPLATDASVAFAVTGGTATAGVDFLARSGRFTIPAGITSKRMVLVALGDTANEGNETVQLTLSDPAGAILDATKSTGTGTILNDDPVSAATDITQYRLYHDGTKEHLYTTDLNEYNVLGFSGWAKEGTAYTMFSNPGTFGGANTAPFFRLYHPGIQQHLWTTDFNEALVLSDTTGWFYEGIIGYLLPQSGSGTTPLYRMSLANPPIHLWTTDLNEYTVLQGLGWVAEGVIGHVRP